MIMDEITLINILNKICEKNQSLTWKLNCKYHDGLKTSVMQINLITARDNSTCHISFHMDTGKIITGRHTGLVPFKRSGHLLDALLEILYYESSKALSQPSGN